MERRSSRSNKGKHTLRELEVDNVYYKNENDLKRQKIEQEEEDDDITEGEVRCTPCGANKSNYNEDTDTGGMMIECEKCETWQHSKCMGYQNKKAIPKYYVCNVCTRATVEGAEVETTETIDNPSVGEASEDLIGTAGDITGSLAGEVDSNEQDDLVVLNMPQDDVSGTTESKTAEVGGAANGNDSASSVSGSAAAAPASNGDIKVIPSRTFYPKETPSLDNLKDKIRKSVAKAFYNVFEKFPSGSKIPPLEYALELESEINAFAPRQGQEKKYTDRSRSLVVLIKKPNVMNRIILRELSFKDLVNLSPEEIDEDFKRYAEKVRQEAIRRLVLTVDDATSNQRVRRTHKGEEIVEDVRGSTDDSNIGDIITSKKIDHRRFDDEVTKHNGDLIPQSNVDNRAVGLENNSDHETETRGSDLGSTSLGDEGDDIPDLDDAELDYILKPKQKAAISQPEVKPVAAVSKPAPKTVKAEETVWSGRISYPDFATFVAKVSFVGCISGTSKPLLAPRLSKVIKEIFSRQSYEIEGKLDRAKAEAYLEKILNTRDLFVAKLGCKEEYSDFEKLQEYLADNKKVGVLSGKPHFVKDSYVFSLSGDGVLPRYLNSELTELLKSEVGLFAVFAAKKDYIPQTKSILKRSPLAAPEEVYSGSSFHSGSGSHETTTKPPVSALDSILSKLGSGPSLPAVPTAIAHLPYVQQQPQTHALSGLSTEQLLYLTGLVQQNPNVQNDPQQLIRLIQQQQTGGGYHQ